MKNLTITDIQAEAWRRGQLSWLLYKHQLPIYDAVWHAINKKEVLKHVLNCSRRFGKTTVLSLIAIEYAFRFPNSQIRFAAPTGKSLRKIIMPIFKMLLETCPKNIKPAYKSSEDAIVFHNGSQIHMAGTDNGHEENLRGTKSNLVLVDEAGSMDNLSYIIKSILVPQTLTVQGTIIIASTPSVSPDHDYYYIYKECQEDDAVSEFTIYDNKSITPETLAIYAKEAGGINSTTFLREYLVKFVTEQEQSIIPEWKAEFVVDTEKDQEYYNYFHRYVGLDIGVRDFTAAVFGYYNFRTATLHIEDEYTINGPDMTTDLLAQGIKDKEKEIWGELPVFKRIADNNNLILSYDLTRLHNLPFMPTNKSTLEAMINQVRMMVAEGRLTIHPRCEMLTGCLAYGIWKNRAGKLEFGKSKKYGHYDHLAALVYLIRNLDTFTNPIPAHHGMNNSTHWLGGLSNQPSSAQAISSIFNK